MVPVFKGHDDYFAAGDIHPNPMGSAAMAKAIWGKMEDDCVWQAASGRLLRTVAPAAPAGWMMSNPVAGRNVAGRGGATRAAFCALVAPVVYRDDQLQNPAADTPGAEDAAHAG
jgi:hypothetical protein